MKLRAPRCNDARSVTELPACQFCQSTGFAASGSPWASADSGNATTASMSIASLTMERDSFGYRLHRIDAAIEWHQHKEGEIRHAAHARQGHVNALRRLQTQVHQTEERHYEQREE